MITASALALGLGMPASASTGAPETGPPGGDALGARGVPWAWGNNFFGQLGDESHTIRNRPVAVHGLAKVSDLSAGYGHSLAVTPNGTPYAWGDNGHGQLGDGTTEDTALPQRVPGLTNVAQMSAGGSHSLAVTTDGQVWAWGRNGSGQLGDGTRTERHEPTLVVGIDHVVAVRAGSNHSLALKADGTVWGWGINLWGNLGDGTTEDRLTPVQADGLDHIVEIATANVHSLAVREDGTAWAWGDNGSGQLGDGTTEDHPVATQVPGLSDVVHIAAAYDHTMAVREDGSVWGWGDSTYGQLGKGQTRSMVPVQIRGIDGVRSVTAGGYHTLVVRTDKTAWAWGYNHRGQLGAGTRRVERRPLQLIELAGVKMISAGVAHSLAFTPPHEPSAPAAPTTWLPPRRLDHQEAVRRDLEGSRTRGRIRQRRGRRIHRHQSTSPKGRVMSRTFLPHAGVVGLVAAAALLPTPATAESPASTELAGYRVQLGAHSTTTTTFEVPSTGTCDPASPVPTGVVTEVMQWGDVRFAGVMATAQCLPGSGQGTIDVDLITSEAGERTLPESTAGDRVRVRIATRDGLTVVAVTNLDRGWRERQEVPSIDASVYGVGDSLAGAGGMSQELVDFGSHRFGRTVVDGRPLGGWDPTRSSVTDFAGARAESSPLRAGGQRFHVRYVEATDR